MVLRPINYYLGFFWTMKIGYARVSTKSQDLSMQLDDLKAAGCEKIFQDVGSGSKFDRVGLKEVWNILRAGDTLIVWRLDRLGRSFKDLVEQVNKLAEHGVHFKSLKEGSIDTTSPTGELIFHIFAVMAHFERNLIRERVNGGLIAARKRGIALGRPPCKENQKALLVQQAYQQQKLTPKEIQTMFNISKSTFYNYIREAHHD